MNEEGRSDRDYFSDWGSCTCNDPDEDECPLSEHNESDEEIDYGEEEG